MWVRLHLRSTPCGLRQEGSIAQLLPSRPLIRLTFALPEPIVSFPPEVGALVNSVAGTLRLVVPARRGRGRSDQVGSHFSRSMRVRIWRKSGPVK